MFQSPIPATDSAPVILVGIDFSAGADRALRRSLMIRRDACCTIVLAHIIDERAQRSPLRGSTEAKNVLGQMRSSVRALDRIPCRSVVRYGRTVDQLSLVADACGADLLVVGSPRTRHLQMPRPTLAEELAARTQRPVLVAKGVPATFYRRALVATKLDRNDVMLMGSLSSLFGSRDLLVDLVHLYDPFLEQMMSWAAVDPVRIREVEESQRLKMQMRLLAKLTSGPLNVESLLTPPSKGPVPLQLLELAADRRCDLIAAASGKSSFLKRALVGSTVTTLVRESEMDVLVMPRHDYSRYNVAG